MSNETWAPGHIYNAATQTGIKFTDTTIELHARPPQGGPSALIARVKRPANLTRWDFWYNLRFAQAFPQIGYWWFGDAWSGKIKVSRPVGRTDATTLFGYVQFTDAETGGEPWMMETGDPLIMSVPLPEHHRHPLNLPLQLAIARLIFGAMTDPRYANTWFDIQSLVRRDELESTFPTTRNALLAEVPVVTDLMELVSGGSPELNLDAPAERVYRLEDHDMPLREVLCRLQGLKPA